MQEPHLLVRAAGNTAAGSQSSSARRTATLPTSVSSISNVCRPPTPKSPVTAGVFESMETTDEEDELLNNRGDLNDEEPDVTGDDLDPIENGAVVRCCFTSLSWRLGAWRSAFAGAAFESIQAVRACTIFLSCFGIMR